MSDSAQELPLTGLKVVDFSRLLPGPWTTQTLADMGADVVKVEQPEVGDYGRFNPPNYQTLGVYFNSVNRNKRSIALALTNPHAREAVLRLIGQADVVVESFRPGVTRKLGIDYDSVKAANPGLIYCSITGFGQEGSLACPRMIWPFKPCRESWATPWNSIRSRPCRASRPATTHRPLTPFRESWER